MVVESQKTIWDKSNEVGKHIIKRGAWGNALDKTNCYTSLIQVLRDMDVTRFDLMEAYKTLQVNKVVGSLYEQTMFGFQNQEILDAFKKIVSDPPAPPPTRKETVLAVIKDVALSDDEKANKIVGNIF